MTPNLLALRQTSRKHPNPDVEMENLGSKLDVALAGYTINVVKANGCKDITTMERKNFN